MNYWAAPELLGRLKISRKKLSKESILAAVCKDFEMDLEEITARGRAAQYLEPRHITCYLLREYARMHFKEIGDLFNRDHTTIIHAVRAVKDRMDTEPDYKARVQRLINKINY